MDRLFPDRKGYEESIAFAPRLSCNSGQLSYAFPCPPPSPSCILVKVEVQVAGPLQPRPASMYITREESKDDEPEMKKWADAPYSLNYQVNSRAWPFFTDKGAGVYRVRAKAQFRDPSRKKATARLFWGPHSDVLYVNYDPETFAPTSFNDQLRHCLRDSLPKLPDALVSIVGGYAYDPLQWDTTTSGSQMVVGRDAQGLATVVRYVRQKEARTDYWHVKATMLSARPLANPSVPSASPSSSSSSSSSSRLSSFSSSSSDLVRFAVRVDYLSGYGLAIGVCHKEERKNSNGFPGFMYSCQSYVYKNGIVKRTLPDEYYTGDIVSVQVDFRAKTIAFGKVNQELQDVAYVYLDPEDSIDFSRPLYACVTSDPNDQVTLLGS